MNCLSESIAGSRCMCSPSANLEVVSGQILPSRSDTAPSANNQSDTSNNSSCLRTSAGENKNKNCSATVTTPAPFHRKTVGIASSSLSSRMSSVLAITTTILLANNLSLCCSAFQIVNNAPISLTPTTTHARTHSHTHTHTSSPTYSSVLWYKPPADGISTSAPVLPQTQSPTTRTRTPTRTTHRTNNPMTNYSDSPRRKRQQQQYNNNNNNNGISHSHTSQEEELDNTIHDNIQNLLSDDDGEECIDMPDYSEEAANEIADYASYSRISEQAQLKANIAVERKTKNNNKPPQQLEVVAASVTASASSLTTHKRKSTNASTTTVKPSSSSSITTTQLRTKVRASVKETGVDTMSQYVKSMGQHELLSKESEMLLGKHIQIVVEWEKIRESLERTLEQAPTFKQWANELSVTVPELKQQIRRSQRAKAALMEANLRLVVTVARQTIKQNKSEINFQDACQEGIIGLKRACEKFDPQQGCRFSTYAVWWIRKEVSKSLIHQSRTVRLPSSAIKKINDIRINERLLISSLGRRPTNEEIALKCNMTVEKLEFYRKAALDATSLDKQLVAGQGKGSSASGGDGSRGKTIESLIQDSGPTPAEIAAKEMLKDDVRRLIRTLSPREQAVIRLRFGLDDGSPRTLDSIAEKFSTKKEIIRKIEAKALLKLRQPYRNSSVKCYMSDI